MHQTASSQRVAELAFGGSIYPWFQLFLNNIGGRYCNSPKEDDNYLIYFVILLFCYLFCYLFTLLNMKEILWF